MGQFQYRKRRKASPPLIRCRRAALCCCLNFSNDLCIQSGSPRHTTHLFSSTSSSIAITTSRKDKLSQTRAHSLMEPNANHWSSRRVCASWSSSSSRLLSSYYILYYEVQLRPRTFSWLTVSHLICVFFVVVFVVARGLRRDAKQILNTQLKLTMGFLRLCLPWVSLYILSSPSCLIVVHCIYIFIYFGRIFVERGLSHITYCDQCLYKYIYI